MSTPENPNSKKSSTQKPSEDIVQLAAHELQSLSDKGLPPDPVAIDILVKAALTK